MKKLYKEICEGCYYINMCKERHTPLCDDEEEEEIFLKEEGL